MTAHMIGVIGVPGSGKSHFARSAAEVGKAAVAIVDPKEATFYRGTATLHSDLNWRPHLREFKATGFQELLAWVAARETDDSQFVVIDPMSEVSDLAMHEVLKLHSTNDPGELTHGRAYTSHDQQLKQLITELRRLVVKGKTVIATFHGKMRELEGAGDAKQGRDFNGKQEWQFEEQMLPVMLTSMRQHVHSPFDLWLYTVPVGFGPGRKYYVTAVPDQVRPAKHSVTFKAGVNPARIPNTVKDLLGMLDE